MGKPASEEATRAARARIGNGRFELLRILGSGGYGSVFEARELATGAHVALKLLHEQTGLSLLRFKQEFRALAEFSHPNVVRFGGLFEEAGQFYFTMELVEGEGLLDNVRPGSSQPVSPIFAPTDMLTTADAGDSGIRGAIARSRREVHDGKLDVARLREAFAQLASGLIALHASGLVHRDLKPQNVLVTRDGRVVLLDFGLALNLDESRIGDLAGTFAYMAPEQALRQEVSESADWYAFGAVLFEALAGRPPHAHRPARNFWAEAQQPLPGPESYVPDLPQDLCALCMDLLAFDPERRPSEAEIAKRLGIHVAAARASASFRSRVHFARNIFVARDHEREVLRNAVARTDSGTSPFVCLVGESGIGKSTLVRHVLGEIVREREVLVLASRCYERETVPYRGIDGVIDQLVRDLGAEQSGREPLTPPPDAEFLAELFPVIRALPGFEGMTRPQQFDLDPHEARKRAFAALKEALRSLSERRPIVIHLDDAQWIDAESVALLSSLRREPLPRMLLLLSSRPLSDDPFEPLRRDAKDYTNLVLQPLSAEESERLVTLMLGELAEPGAHRPDTELIARTSGGHPLFIHELVVHAGSHEKKIGTLDGAIGGRLDLLAGSSRGLLDLVALAAAPLKHSVAQVASGLSPEDYPWALATLRGENLVSFHALSSTDEVQAYHDRIRELVVRRMDGSARRSAHRRLAEALEQRAPDELDALAHHFAGAGDAAATVRYARAAGDRSLQKLAFENAAELFGMALRFEQAPLLRGELETRLGQALGSAGHGREAAEAYLRAARLASSDSSVELRRRAGEQLLRAGHVERGTEILFSMLRQLGLSVPLRDFTILISLVWALLRLTFRGLKLRTRTKPPAARERLRLDVCWTVATGLSLVHHLRATEFQARTLLFALDMGDVDRVIKCAALLGVTLGMADGPTRKLAQQLRARASSLALTSPSHETTAWLQLTDGVASMGDWEFASCERLCAQAEATLATRCKGASWEIVTAQAFALWSTTFRGDFRAVGARLPRLLASARSRGDRHAETALILSPVHLLGLGSDEPVRVREECERSMAEWPSTLGRFQHMCGAYVLAQVALYQSRPEAAWRHVSYAWQMLRRGHLSRVQFQRVDLLGLRARAALAQAAASAGSARKAWLSRARQDVRRLRREGIPAALALADMTEGGAHHLDGDDHLSLPCFAKAGPGFERLGMSLHASVVALAQGTLTQDLQVREGAERQLEALGVVNASGMLRLWLPGLE